MENIIVKIIAYGSDEYNDTLRLRDKILRKPLKMDLFAKDLSHENEDYHFAAFCGDTLVGVTILTHLENGDAKMRQVAVDFDYQGRGIGRKMADFAESFARENGYAKIELNARETAIPFYERIGYTADSEIFLEIGIPHKRMYKIL